MAQIVTTHGLVDEATLARTTGFEDRPNEYVVWVEWRIHGHDGTGCPVCADLGNPRPDERGVLVKRDVWANLKQGVSANAVAGGF